MNNNIKKAFKKEKVFAGYITVGDGGLEKTLAAAKALIAGGVNLLELGVPFSDPIADGPVIQRAAERALKNHTTLFDVIQLAAELRKTTQIPLVLFSYFNPLLHANPDLWLPKAREAGIDAVLVVDLPFEEGHAFYKNCLTHDVLPIPVITPATTPERLKVISRYAKGFLYYAMRKGTTGVRAGLPEGFAAKLAEIKSVTHLPILAGFGISTPLDAKEVLREADGFVVGSLFVKTLEEGKTMEELKQLARSFSS